MGVMPSPNTHQRRQLVQAVEQHVGFAGHVVVRQAEAVDPGDLVTEM